MSNPVHRSYRTLNFAQQYQQQRRQALRELSLNANDNLRRRFPAVQLNSEGPLTPVPLAESSLNAIQFAQRPQLGHKGQTRLSTDVRTYYLSTELLHLLTASHYMHPAPSASSFTNSLGPWTPSTLSVYLLLLNLPMLWILQSMHTALSLPVTPMNASLQNEHGFLFSAATYVFFFVDGWSSCLGSPSIVIVSAPHF